MENQQILKEDESQSGFKLLSSQNQVQSNSQIGQTDIPKEFEKVKKKLAINFCCAKVFKIVQKKKEQENSFQELNILEDEKINQKKSKKQFKIKFIKKDQPSYSIKNGNNQQLNQQVDQKQFDNTLSKIQKIQIKFFLIQQSIYY